MRSFDLQGYINKMNSMGKVRFFGYHFIISVYRITFIGVVFHEFAHEMLVKWRGYNVYEVEYLSHVKHDMPQRLIDALLIAYAPFIVNTSLAFSVLYIVFDAFPVSLASLQGSSLEITVFKYAVLFFAFSLVFHAVPSLEDVQNVKKLLDERLKWYRIDLILFSLPFMIIFAPTWLTLSVIRKRKVRFVIDFSFAIFAFITLFGVIEWWTYVLPIGEYVIEWVWYLGKLIVGELLEVVTSN